MEGRVDLSALERSRLLGPLSTGALGPLRAPSTLSEAESLGQAMAVAAAADSERARPGSPSARQPYGGHLLPPSGLHASSSSYAMMASYLASTGHVPESLKHMLPADMQQYWSTSQSENYTRYLLGNMCYPYSMPCMPATESLALFAHNSASAAQHQLEALQAQAVQHRIYDLQKEALASHGMLPHLYPYSHLYPPTTGQMEATNLSLPSSSKTKQGETSKDDESRYGEERKERDGRNRTETDTRRADSKSSEHCIDFSKHADTPRHSDSNGERKRGRLSKTDDIDKIKNRSKALKSPTIDSSRTSNEKHSVPCLIDIPRPTSDTDKELRGFSAFQGPDRRRHHSSGSVRREVYQTRIQESTSHGKHSLYSPPQRHKAVSSPERTSTVSRNPDRKQYATSSPQTNTAKQMGDQDMPENLCIKDSKRDGKGDKDTKTGDKTSVSVVKTQTVDTATTVTVTSTLNIITSDVGNKDKTSRRKASSISPPSQKSPSSTSTTYSVPYYHSLFSRAQPNEANKVHATTYVPEVGTISSPVVGAPAIIQVKETKGESKGDRDEHRNENKRNDANVKSQVNADGSQDKCVDGSDKKGKNKDVNEPEHSSKAEGCNSLQCVQKDKTTQEGETSDVDETEDKEKHVKRKRSFSIDSSQRRNNKAKANTTNKNEDVSVISPSDSLHSKPNKAVESLNTKRDKSTKDLGENKVIDDKSAACDLKSDSTEQNKVTKSAKTKVTTKSVPSSNVDNAVVITVSDTEDKDGEHVSDLPKSAFTKCDELSKYKPFSNSKQTTIVKPIPICRTRPDIDMGDRKATGTPDSVRNKLPESKHTDGHSNSTGIPVGIAVARQRNIAPKAACDKDTMRKGTDEPKTKHSVADVKPIRPLKVIRPSTKGVSNAQKIEKRNELPANLIVTGGTSPSSVFWPEDPASRQMAAQVLQNNHPMTPTTWYGQSAFPMPPSITSSPNVANPASQLPLTVPAGYKLAQDSVTGQLLLLPSSTDLFDNSRIFSGMPLGSTVAPGSPFGPATLLTGGSATAGQGAIFPGQTILTDRPANIDMNIPSYLPMFGSNVLPSVGVSGKDDSLTTTSEIVRSHIQQEAVSVTMETGGDKHTVISLSKTAISTDGSLIPDSFNFPAPTVPVVFNPTIIPTQPITDHATIHEDQLLKQDLSMSVQSRGTSPMLPASDSCPDDNTKSDDNADDIIDICEVDSETKSVDDHDNVIEKMKNDTESEIKDESIVVDHSNHMLSRKVDLDESMIEDNSVTCDAKPILETSSNCDNILQESNASKSTKSNRNIFKEMSGYDPFMDPQVLQAADGLELLSALAEKSALVVKPETTESPETDKKDTITSVIDEVIKREAKVKLKSPKEKVKTKKRLEEDVSIKEKTFITSPKKKPRVKCGYSFKAKIDTNAAVEATEEKKMTTFCGISIPEDLDSFLEIDDDVIDSIEMEMKMRLAELQKRYKDKKKQLAKLTPKKARDSTEQETDKQKSIGDTPRGPGRPKKRSRESSSTETNTSCKSPKTTKKTEHSNQKSPPSGVPIASHHGHSTKRKKMAEMLVDRVFRKSGSSFKIPLSKKVNLIAPARIEFPGGTVVSEKSEHARHKKSVDFKKLIKRSRLSQINGKDGSFAGAGFWNKKYHERKHHFHPDAKLKKRKKEQVSETISSADGGLGLLAEYAAKSRDDSIKKKRKSEEVASTITSPDSPTKKRKPGRPKKCDVVQPGITETIVAKQSKHMDFFRWQNEEPKQERKISLEGKTPLKPLYLDEWNVRRSERIFLSDPSPQTSPDPVSPGSKAKTTSPGLKLKIASADVKPKIASPDVKAKTASPGLKVKTTPLGLKMKVGSSGHSTKMESSNSDRDAKQKVEKAKKSQSLNLSLKVKKKYSAGSNQQQQRAREKTTELLKASRDRLSQSRLEKREKLLQQVPPVIKVTEDSDTEDVPLSLFKAKPKTIDLPSCALEQTEMEDGMRILVFMDGLFHEGELKAIRPPDVYGAVLDTERKTRPHYYSLEEILKEAIKDTKPDHGDQLKEGTRICAYWSQQFSCLYPGTISKASADDDDSDKNLFNVDFDDTDTGKIPLDHIRIIPQDFPHVEYDPNPLLLLTKRRRTLSVSDTSDQRKSQSDSPKKSVSEAKDTKLKSISEVNKEVKVKRGPGRPPKTERLVSMETIGDEDVFCNESSKGNKNSKTERKNNEDSDDSEAGGYSKSADVWQWSGSCTKRPGMKGRARKEYYKTIYRHKEHISVGDCAVFISTGRPNLPYVGRIESFWETWSGQMIVKVKWFYHPEETKGGKRLHNMKGALFRSDHEDENDVQTIKHKCDVIPYADYKRRVDVISHDTRASVYYLAGAYEPTVGHIKFEAGVL